MANQPHTPARNPLLDKLLLTYCECAKLTGRSAKYFYLLGKRRELPIVKMGRTVGIRPADLIAWIAVLAAFPMDSLALFQLV